MFTVFLLLQSFIVTGPKNSLHHLLSIPVVSPVCGLLQLLGHYNIIQTKSIRPAKPKKWAVNFLSCYKKFIRWSSGWGSLQLTFIHSAFTFIHCLDSGTRNTCDKIKIWNTYLLITHITSYMKLDLLTYHTSYFHMHYFTPPLDVSHIDWVAFYYSLITSGVRYCNKCYRVNTGPLLLTITLINTNTFNL